jgi:predicted dehydrogenase
LVAKRFGIDKSLADYRALLDDPKVDVVAVCTPPDTHAAMAQQALRAGKHVFVEKPPALSVEDCEVMERMASEAGRQIMVGLNQRFHPLVREARRISSEGRLGRVLLLQSACTSGLNWRQDKPPWRNCSERGGGVLLELAIHHFDLVRFLLGAEFVCVAASSDKAGRAAGSAATLGVTRAGARVASIFSEATSDDNRIEIYGEKGRLWLSLYQCDGLEFHPLPGYPGDLKVRLQSILGFVREAAHQTWAGNYWLESYRAQWRSFLASVRSGAPSAITLADAKEFIHNKLNS